MEGKSPSSSFSSSFLFVAELFLVRATLVSGAFLSGEILRCWVKMSNVHLMYRKLLRRRIERLHHPGHPEQLWRPGRRGGGRAEHDRRQGGKRDTRQEEASGGSSVVSCNDSIKEVQSSLPIQVGTTPDAAVFTFEELAHQTISHSDVDIGDSFTMRATLDLPGIALEDKSDLKFHAFGFSPSKGENGKII